MAGSAAGCSGLCTRGTWPDAQQTHHPQVESHQPCARSHFYFSSPYYQPVGEDVFIPLLSAPLVVQMEKSLDLHMSSGLASQRGCVVVSPVMSYKGVEQGMCFGGPECGAGGQCLVMEVNAECLISPCPRGSQANVRQLPSHLPWGF